MASDDENDEYVAGECNELFYSKLWCEFDSINRRG